MCVTGVLSHLLTTYTYIEVLGFGHFGLVVKVRHVSGAYMAMKVTKSLSFLLEMELSALIAISESSDWRTQHLVKMFEFLTVWNRL